MSLEINFTFVPVSQHIYVVIVMKIDGVVHKF